MRQNRYCIFRDFILHMSLIYNELSIGTQIRGQNVCWKVVDGRHISYCCFNHYLLDGRCHECKPGTTSTDGIVCLPCSENWYGHKCKYRCDCELYQRCDSDFGCLEQTETFPQLEISSQPVISSKLEISRQTEISSQLEISSEPEISSHTESENESRSAILYIILVSAGLITWLVFVWICSKHFYQRIRPEGSRTSQMRLQTEHLQLKQVNGTTLVQNKSVLRRNRLPVKRQYLYDSAWDIYPCNEQPHIDHADREGDSFESSDETHNAPNGSNLINKEMYLNPYKKLNEKRDT